MNWRKVYSMLLGGIIYFISVFLLTGYGNKLSHPDINNRIVNAFLDKNNKGTLNSKFQNYLFALDSKKLKGTGVTKDGFFHPEDLTNVGYGYFEEGQCSFSPSAWISHGAYSADVPEVPASLRHFYDPTKLAGQRYLTDIANAKLMGFMQTLFTNPKIDGLEWAVGQPNSAAGVQEHYYTWENGKVFMKMALEQADADKRSELMARVWRSLGETLHMVADHGCPSHVRNDAHPSPLMNNNTIFGNPDPYEEYVDYIRKKDLSGFKQLFNGSPDASLKTELSQAKNVRAIAHSLALFVNKNFFTTETITGNNRYGNAVKPLIHKATPYASPLLHSMEYKKNYYVSQVGSTEVKQCTDISYFAGFLPRLVYPYVDLESVRSQASVLFPNIVEAGVQAMQLYIPKLNVEIKSAEGGKVTGVIKHIVDEEYKSEIKYNGEVVIKITDKKYKRKKDYKIKAKDGKFEGSGIVYIEGDYAFAEIEFGGVYVKSSEFKCGQSVPFNYIQISLEATTNFLNYGNYGNDKYFYINTFSGKPSKVEFTTRSFSIEHTVDNTSYYASGTIEDGVVKSIKITFDSKTYQGNVLEYTMYSYVELVNQKIALSDVDPTDVFGTIFSIKPEAGMVRSMAAKDEYRSGGTMYTGRTLNSYDSSKLINDGKITVAVALK